MNNIYVKELDKIVSEYKDSARILKLRLANSLNSLALLAREMDWTVYQLHRAGEIVFRRARVRLHEVGDECLRRMAEIDAYSTLIENADRTVN